MPSSVFKNIFRFETARGNYAKDCKSQKQPQSYKEDMTLLAATLRCQPVAPKRKGSVVANVAQALGLHLFELNQNHENVCRFLFQGRQ